MSAPEPISAQSARELVAHGALLIDVRGEEARSADGAIDNATPVEKSDVEAFAASHDSATPIVVFCGSTRGSGPVVEALAEHGFTTVNHVEGGYDALKAETTSEDAS